MGRLICILTLICILSACGPSDDKKAMHYIDAAKVSLNEGKFSVAKLQIDSIKQEYPKAFETRKQGIRLMLDVEKQEQLKGLEFLEEDFIAKTDSLDTLKKKYRYKFEKDEGYQDIGIYSATTQALERNYNRSFLRFTVDETGKMTMTSFYYGSFPIKHNTVHVATKKSTFVETPVATNLYTTSNLGQITERQDFILGKDDGNVIDFIIMNQDSPLYVTYKGERPYKYRLSDVDVKAAVEIEQLTNVLNALNNINQLQAEAHKKLNFINKRIEKFDLENTSTK